VRCPFCDSLETKVLETRDAESAVRRRRACSQCEKRFTTYERIDTLPLAVRKRDGSEQAFDREKLIGGLVRAAYPRQLDAAFLEHIGDAVTTALGNAGGELPSERIGELVLRELRDVDPVAYIRFASVYRNFSDVAEFESELSRLVPEDAPPTPSSVRGEAEDPVFPPNTVQTAVSGVAGQDF
jgi:transcriptional repressor NrdR